MSTNPPAKVPAAGIAAAVAPPRFSDTEGVLGVKSLEDPVEKRLDEIEMIGEEDAAGFRPRGSEVTPGMRYLHCSRTIQQLVTDRNRAVGLYLAVASLSWTASTALLNAHPRGELMIPIESLQRYSLPVTFGALSVLAIFVGFLLIRTRIGLIYEVAKMNVLLGLPVGRVKRVNPLSIFFIMHALISVAGGGSATLLAYHLLKAGAASDLSAWFVAVACGVGLTLVLLLLYVATVLVTTADRKLRDGSGG